MNLQTSQIGRAGLTQRLNGLGWRCRGLPASPAPVLSRGLFVHGVADRRMSCTAIRRESSCRSDLGGPGLLLGGGNASLRRALCPWSGDPTSDW